MRTVLGVASRSWGVSVFFIFAGLAACGGLRAQSLLQVIGEPYWAVQNGMCKFTLSGETKIINSGQADYLSGSLRMGLAMTPNPFPDAGMLVSSADIGQLPGGYEYSNFSTSAPVAIPPVTGFRYFTFVLEEYTGTGWFTHFSGRSGVNYLKEGVVEPPPLWKPPTGRVIPPPVTNPAGMKVVFNQRALQFEAGKVSIIPKFNQFTASARLNRSGRTVVYIGAEPNGKGADWSYKGGHAKWKGKRHDVGTLVIDHGVLQGMRAKSTYWLFFLKKGRGFYKGSHVSGKDSFTGWGSFTLQ